MATQVSAYGLSYLAYITLELSISPELGFPRCVTTLITNVIPLNFSL